MRRTAVSARARAAAVSAVVLALAAAACTGPAEPPSPDSTTTSAVPVFDEPVSLPWLQIGEPVWGSDDVQVKGLGQIDFLGDTAIVGGGEGPASSKGWIQAVEAPTGRVLWTQAKDAPLPGGDATLWSTSFTLVDDGAAGLVVVEYFRDGCDAAAESCPGAVGRPPEQGVAALSTSDGSVRWTHATLPTSAVGTDGTDAADDATTALMSGMTVDAAGAVLTLVGPGEAVHGSQIVESGAVGTIALDPVTGEERWRINGVIGRWVVGDAVVGTAQPVGTLGSVTRGNGAPLVLDAATGQQRWSKAAEYPAAVTNPPSADLIAVQPVSDDAVTGGHLLSLADGSVVADIGETTSFVTDQTTGFVAWSPLGEFRELRSFAPGDAEPLAAAADIPDDYLGPELTYGGYVLVLNIDSAARTETTLALDRAGNPVSDPIPGRVQAMTDDWLVTVARSSGSSGGYDSFAVRDLTP